MAAPLKAHFIFGSELRGSDERLQVEKSPDLAGFSAVALHHWRWGARIGRVPEPF